MLLIKQNETYYTYSNDAFQEVAGPVTKELIEQEGVPLSLFNQIPGSKWDAFKEGGPFQILQYIENEIETFEEIDELQMQQETQTDTGIISKVSINPSQYPMGTIKKIEEIEGAEGPGPTKFIGGDMTQGFLGEVEASEFITGDALASEIGLSAGTAQHSNEPWLKFALDNKILFVAKKPFRHSISWDDIHDRNAVYGDVSAPVVEINGYQFKVRLLKGSNSDPVPWEDENRGAIGSEWNRLMYPIHEHAGTSNWNYSQYVEDNVPNWGVGYTDADLVTESSAGSGSASWTQETQDTDSSRRLRRGGVSVSLLGSYPSSGAIIGNGWRPVLELL